jgi:small GTP-binding protein
MKMAENKIQRRKIVMVGERGVGKTSLVKRFVKNEFDEKYQSTFGSFTEKKEGIKYPDGRELTLMIEDLLGEHGGRRDPPFDLYMKGAKGVLAVFDIEKGREGTINAIADYWVPKVRQVAGDVPLYLVGNKHDLRPDVTYFGQAIAPILPRLKGVQVDGCLTSAKTAENVDQAFYKLGEMMLKRGAI